MKRIKTLISIAIIVVLCLESTGLAINRYAIAEEPPVFSGSVNDSNGSALSGVNVAVFESSSDITKDASILTVVTDSSGSWEVKGLQYGSTYKLVFSKNGYVFSPSELEINEMDLSSSRTHCDHVIGKSTKDEPSASAEIVTGTPYTETPIETPAAGVTDQPSQESNIVESLGTENPPLVPTETGTAVSTDQPQDATVEPTAIEPSVNVSEVEQDNDSTKDNPPSLDELFDSEFPTEQGIETQSPVISTVDPSSLDNQIESISKQSSLDDLIDVIASPIVPPENQDEKPTTYEQSSLDEIQKLPEEDPSTSSSLQQIESEDMTVDLTSSATVLESETPTPTAMDNAESINTTTPLSSDQSSTSSIDLINQDDEPLVTPEESPLVDDLPTETPIPEIQKSISISIDPVYAKPGDIVTLIATVIGYEGASYQWQWADIPDNTYEGIIEKSQDSLKRLVIDNKAESTLTWNDEKGANESIHHFIADPENLNRYWRIVIDLAQPTQKMVNDELPVYNPTISFLQNLICGVAYADDNTTVISDAYASLMQDNPSSLLLQTENQSSKIASPLSCEISFDKTSVNIGDQNTASFTIMGGIPPYTIKSAYWTISEGNETQTIWIDDILEHPSLVVKFGDSGVLCLRISDSTGQEIFVESNSFIINGATSIIPLSCSMHLSNSTITIGEPITASWNVSGGTAPYTYMCYWSVSNDGGQVYHGSNETMSQISSYIPRLSGRGSILLHVKDVYGRQADFYSESFSIIGSNENVNQILCSLSLDAESITCGNTISASCIASGGSVPYSYYFHWEFYDSEGVYTDYFTFQNSAISYYTPSSWGQGSVQVDVRDANDRVQFSDTYSFKVLAAEQDITNPLSCDIVINKTSIATGSSIESSFEVTGGREPYQCSCTWEILEPNGSTVTLFDNHDFIYEALESSKSYSLDFTPLFGISGYMKLRISDANNYTKTFLSPVFSISGAAYVDPLYCVIDLDKAVYSVNNTVSAQWQVSGGTPPYSYVCLWSITESNNNRIYIEQDNTANPSAALQVKAGQYGQLTVIVTDSLGRTGYFNSGEFVILGTAVTKPLDCILTLDKSTVATNSEVTATCFVDGGTPPYKYTYSLIMMDSNGNTLSTEDMDSQQASKSFTPSAGAKGRIVVSITDAVGRDLLRSVDFFVDQENKKKQISTLPAVIPSQKYTGYALTPAISILDGNTTLVVSKDYSVAYKNNINVGAGSAVITGLGLYTGSQTISFQIIAPTPTPTVYMEVENRVIGSYLNSEDNILIYDAMPHNIHCKVVSSTPWTARMISLGTWLSFPTSGIGTTEIVISMPQCPSFVFYGRQCIIEITAGTIVYQLALEQRTHEDSIIVEGSLKNFKSEVLSNNVQMLQITAYDKWKVTSSASWLRASPSNGDLCENQIVNVSVVEDNIDVDARSAYLTFVSGMASTRIKVTQNGTNAKQADVIDEEVAKDQEPFQMFDFALTLSSDIEIPSDCYTSVSWTPYNGAAFYRISVYNHFTHEEVTSTVYTAGNTFANIGPFIDGIYDIIAYALNSSSENLVYASKTDRSSTDTTVRSNMLTLYSGTQAWAWPAPGVRKLISGFTAGKKDLEAMRTGGAEHNAIDINDNLIKEEDKEEPVIASRDGTIVKYVEFGANGGTACVIVMEHRIPNGKNGTITQYSRYVHLKSSSLGLYGYNEEGKWTIVSSIGELKKNKTLIKRGQQIAIFGNTGDSGGSHLHFCIISKSNQTADISINIMPLNNIIGRYSSSGWAAWA